MDFRTATRGRVVVEARIIKLGTIEGDCILSNWKTLHYFDGDELEEHQVRELTSRLIDFYTERFNTDFAVLSGGEGSDYRFMSRRKLGKEKREELRAFFSGFYFGANCKEPATKVCCDICSVDFDRKSTYRMPAGGGDVIRVCLDCLVASGRQLDNHHIMELNKKGK